MLKMTPQDKSLMTRVEILEGQIDRAIESGETHNIMGMSMEDQIKDWRKAIAKAQNQLSINVAA